MSKISEPINKHMNVKKIIGVGDSFMFGDELDDDKADITCPTHTVINSQFRQENCFLGQLAGQFNAEHVNLGYPGASLSSMRDAIIHYIAQGNDLTDTVIVVGLTQPWRISWFNNQSRGLWYNDHVHSTWLLSDTARNKNSETTVNNYDPIWYEQLEFYLKYQECTKASLRNFNQSLVFFEGLTAQFNVKVVQINVFVQEFNNDDVIDVPSYNDFGIVNHLHKVGSDKYFLNGGHPTVEGHKIIADLLESHIKSNTPFP